MTTIFVEKRIIDFPCKLVLSDCFIGDIVIFSIDIRSYPQAKHPNTKIKISPEMPTAETAHLFFANAIANAQKNKRAVFAFTLQIAVDKLVKKITKDSVELLPIFGYFTN